MQTEVDEAHLRLLSRFVVLMYDKTSVLEDVNEARKQLFTQKNRSIENIPPTKGALIQHAKRACYQARHCWSQSLVSSPSLPGISEWGWTQQESYWYPLWTTLAEA